VKNLFLALLLANLLFLGWQHWIAPPDGPAGRLLSSGPEPDITPMGMAAKSPAQGGAAQAPGSGEGPGPVGSANGRCLRIGPIADGEMADTLRARLAGQGFDAATAAEEGQIWVGHWVQLESVASREEADRIAARLAAGGLPDAYVLQTSPPFSISLGVFRDRDRAAKVAAAAAQLGFRPQTTDRYRAGIQYWLTAAVPPGRALPLDELARESGQILRADQVTCAADSVGGAGGIH
jgi:hypothetical protein